MKIFLAGYNTAHLLTSISAGLRELGYDFATCSYSKNHVFYGNDKFDYDFSPNEFVKNVYVDKNGAPVCEPVDDFFRFVEQFDTFIFISTKSLLPGLQDLPLLKKMGKKIIVKQTGSDARFVYPGSLMWNYGDVPFIMQRMDALGISVPNPLFNNPLQYLENIVYAPYFGAKLYNTCMVGNYANAVVTSPLHSSLYVSPFFAGINSFYPEGIRPRIPGRQKPIIVLAPSRTSYKGTPDIEKALDELKDEGLSFELVYVRNMPNAKLKQLLSYADIVIDELSCGGHGTLANESMASGCAVLSSNQPSMQPLPCNRPVIPINRKNLRRQIRRTVLDIPFRIKIAEAGIVYANRFHTPISTTRYLMNCLDRSEKQDYDYYTTLFLDTPFWPDYKGWIEKTAARFYSPDQPIEPGTWMEAVPDFLKILLIKTIMRHGAHPDTDLEKFASCGLLGNKPLQSKLIKRWDCSELKRINPWIWTGPNAAYGPGEEDSVPYSELAGDA